MTVIFISSQHFTKATKVLQKGKGMVERVNQWRQMQSMKYDACVLKTDVQKKFLLLENNKLAVWNNNYESFYTLSGAVIDLYNFYYHYSSTL